MSAPASAIVAFSSHNAAPKISRPTVNFQPSVWGDHFLQYASQSMPQNKQVEIQQRAEHLKEDIRRQLLCCAEEVLEKLKMIDNIQRLGVSYHFQNEIENLLQHLHQNAPSWNGKDVEDGYLYNIALWFRLLRQQGYYVSCDIFEKFRDDKGKLKMILIGDVEGMLALYEAAYLRIHGEEILDQALEFTQHHLKSRLDGMTPYLREKVARALNCPLRKCVPRLESRYYISLYSRDESRNDTLLEFAALDFNILQHHHQMELSHITEWWKKLDFGKKVAHARDRIVEGYFWPLATLFEKKYSKGRIIVTKLLAMVSSMDDTYDAYGTIDELKLFTEAIQRWDINLMNSLPECMKVIFEAILDLLSEIELLIEEDGISSLVEYIKPAIQDLAKAYLVEAEWGNKGCIPTYKEYISNGLITSTYIVFIKASFLGLGKIATKEVFDWVSNYPKIFKAALIIGRLANDLATHKLERKRKHHASAVECCMQQYGISEEKAYKILQMEMENAWKDTNEEWMTTNVVPMVVLEYVISFSQASEFFYAQFEDKYTNGELLKDHVSALLLDPVSVHLHK